MAAYSVVYRFDLRENLPGPEASETAAPATMRTLVHTKANPYRNFILPLLC
jgi:hypothetical protein